MAGTITKNYLYDAFGNEQTGAADTNPFRYAGEYFDTESGNIYLRNRYYDASTGRFITEDPIRDGTNWYAYANNNPIMYIDPWGLAPSVMEAAEMANHIYNYDMSSTKEDRTIAGWRLIDVWYGRESMKMGFYIRDDDNWENPSEYVIVFMGTPMTDLTAWKNNIEQGIGTTSADTWDAINYAAGFVSDIGNIEVTFVGHSKGGQEARSAALRTNKAAIVFNPAAVNVTGYGLSTDNYTANMQSFIVDGDILDVLNKGFVKINGDLKIIPAGSRINLPSDNWNPVSKHFMEEVFKGLKKQGY